MKLSLLVLLGTVLTVYVHSQVEVPVIPRNHKDGDAQVDFDETDIFEKHIVGSLGIYLLEEELELLMQRVLLQFPEVIQRVEVGQTYLGANIHGYALGLNLEGEYWNDKNRPAILIDGAHHARELTSVSMSVYYILRLLYEYAQGESNATQMLGDSTIYVIPVVNLDGYRIIGQNFKQTGQLTLIRKNRHVYDGQLSLCQPDQYGVDLNRNYEYEFGIDNTGSSGENNVCAEDYRGPNPFSEPETSAIRSFLLARRNIYVAVNLHAYGNLFIFPFNFDIASNNLLATQFPDFKDFYGSVVTLGGLPKGDLPGNGATTIQYTANGEASDYMLGSLRIFAMSPELGSSDQSSNTFFIQESQDLKKVLSQNYKWLDFTARSMYARIQVKHLVTTFNETTNVVNVSLIISNMGYLHSRDSIIDLKYNTDIFTNLSIEQNFDSQVVLQKKETTKNDFQVKFLLISRFKSFSLNLLITKQEKLWPTEDQNLSISYFQTRRDDSKRRIDLTILQHRDISQPTFVQNGSSSFRKGVSLFCVALLLILCCLFTRTQRWRDFRGKWTKQDQGVQLSQGQPTNPDLNTMDLKFEPAEGPSQSNDDF